MCTFVFICFNLQLQCLVSHIRLGIKCCYVLFNVCILLYLICDTLINYYLLTYLFTLTPHFYIVKMGFTGVYIIFLFSYLRVPTINVLSKNKKNIFKKNHLKIIIFTAVKYHNILHGHVCVMIGFNTNLIMFNSRYRIYVCSFPQFISQCLKSFYFKIFEVLK